ncbi:hypothetical protein [Alicyclobacillus suci]|uniref:hypothetical protein n=1 Tax=Alicyclobacillus suci TaxID=2816080 RepID=UPI001A90AD51|nr:hypothetical protein [Alicyclobacillus suci]
MNLRIQVPNSEVMNVKDILSEYLNENVDFEYITCKGDTFGTVFNLFSTALQDLGTIVTIVSLLSGKQSETVRDWISEVVKDENIAHAEFKLKNGRVIMISNEENEHEDREP